VQDKNLQALNKAGLICGLPKPFWEILGRQGVPTIYWEFGDLDYVAVACTGECKCMLVMQRRQTRSRQIYDGLYTCTVCSNESCKVGGGSKVGNQQERFLLEKVKEHMDARPEPFLCCCQLPLGGKRCDVVLVPLHATAVNQLIVLELDGTDHLENPRLHGLSRCAAFNAVVDRDAEKASVVSDAGMQFMRISISEISGTGWTKKLNSLLDQAATV